MTELPTVACILLTRDRPATAAQAIASFRAQAYQNKELIIWNTGPHDLRSEDVRHFWLPEHEGRKSIGMLRNDANGAAQGDMLAHFDDDDWSAPERITEQVALLQSSKADCVGYSDMLFWDSRPGHFCGAWLYTATTPRTPPGTSLCYWCRTWEQKPFGDQPRPGKVTAEEYDFLRDLNVVTCSSIVNGVPRMIARVHSGNTSQEYARKIGGGVESPNWRRAPEFDEYCRGVFDDSRS